MRILYKDVPAAIEIEGDSAVVSSHDRNLFAIGDELIHAGQTWIVTSIYLSPYISSVTNAALRKGV